MKLAIVNASTLVSDSDVRLMTSAVKKQVYLHALPAYGMSSKSVEIVFVPTGGTAPADAYPIVIMDDADQAGALGYHTEDPGGKVWGRVFARPVLSNGGFALAGSLSVSTVLSHEVLETIFDLNVNMWVDRYDNTFVAKEVSDPVENDEYPVDVQDHVGVSVHVSVSNFVTLTWFDPQADASSKFDWMGTVKAPLTMSPGGYVVVLDTTNGQVTQVFGSDEAKKLHEIKKPAHPAARAVRRGVPCS